MKTRYLLAILLSCLAALSACDREARMSEKGFRLPQGDAQAGRETFIDMRCHQCHTIAGEELPVIPALDPPYVELGGRVAKVKTYGELVTAIIFPSNDLARGYAEEVVSEDGESKMYDYTKHMTVQELADIVTFLQPHYEFVVPTLRYTFHP